jgi:hypothetical protein
MELFDFIVKSGHEKSLKLDKEYRKLINNVILNNNEDIEARWETYNLIIKELFTIDDGKYFQEIKYRLTDGEDANLVFLDIISRYSSTELTFLVWFLKKRIDEYVDDDFFKRFLI